MRIVIACAALLLLSAVPANAIERLYWAPDDPLERDHWAYDAMAYLVARGVFNGHDIEHMYLYDEFGPVELTPRKITDAAAWAFEDSLGRHAGNDHIYLMLTDLLLAFGPQDEAQAEEAEPHTAFDEVPVGHWAYPTLAHFMNTGALDGYPEGFFSGQRALTRYELAQAIARLRDTWVSSGNGSAKADFYLLEALRSEFVDQLCEMGKI